MAKYGKRIVDEIIRLIKADTFTNAEICAKVGISNSTFHNWLEDHPDFAAKIESAKAEMMESMVLEAKNSLRRKLTGYDVKETRVETVPNLADKDEKGNPKPKIKKQITTTKHVAADTAAIIFVLTNGDPTHWKNRQVAEVTGANGKDLFKSMTDEELDAMIKEQQRKLDG